MVLGALALLVVGSVAIAGTTPEKSPTGAAVPQVASSMAKPAPTVGAVPQVASPVAKPAPVKAAVPRAAGRVATKPAVRDTGSGLIAVRGQGAIYLVDPVRGSSSRIPGTAKMAQPAWSPNGGLLAVARVGADGTSVYTIKPDGSHPQLVLRHASSPSWSPDGRRLVVARDGSAADEASSVYMTVRPDGSDAHQVTFEGDDFYDSGEPALPPDGNWIAFFGDDGANPASFDSSAAAWSPDGAHLAFVSESPTTAGVDTTSSLWTVAVDGGKPHLLAAGIYGRPSWG